jgi:hypothetical protein
MRKLFDYDEHAYPVTGAFAYLLRQPANAQWVSDFLAGSRFDIDEGFSTEEEAINEFREAVSARMPGVGLFGPNEPLVDWSGLFKFLEAATRPGATSEDSSNPSLTAPRSQESNVRGTASQTGESDEDYMLEEARQRTAEARARQRREEVQDALKVGLGFIFAIPIILGIGSIVLDMLGIVVKNLLEVASFLGFALFFLGGLAFVGKLMEFGSQGQSGSGYVYSALYPPDWEQIRARVLDRDGHRCGNCGSTRNLHVHHIVPLSKGGVNSESNLRTLCKDCHALLHPHMKS